MPGLFISDRKVPTHSIGGFTSTERFYSGDSTGPQVNTTAFSAWVVIKTSKNFSAGIGHIFGKGSAWNFFIYNGTYTFDVGGNFPANSTAPKKYQNPGAHAYEDAYMTVFHGVVRDSVIYLYKNGKATGDGIAITDFTFLTTTTGVSIGARAVGGDLAPYIGGVIACGIASSTGLTDEQVEAHYQSLLADNPYATSTGATHLWRAVDAGATWTDTIAGLAMTRTGSITPTSQSLAFYKRFDPAWDYTSTTPILPPLSNTPGGMKVMTIGDSRTIGGTVSHRYICWTEALASDDMNNMEYVGIDDGFDYNNYWAKGGSAAGNFLRGDCCGMYAGELADKINLYEPHIVVLWFGHNATDAVDGVSLKDDFINLIRAIHAINNDTRFLLLSELEGKLEGGDLDAKHQEFSNWLQRTCSVQLDREGIKHRLCWIYGILNPATDFLDEVHPNVPDPITDVEGYNKIGVKVWPALRLTAGYTN